MSNTKKYLLVAAIDIGTTYSGFAFSFKHEYDLNPLKVTAHTWPAATGGVVSLKTPTSVLFDPDKNFHSFGYEAEEKYGDLAMDDEHQNWYLFSRFKMTLYDAKTLERDFLLYDVRGKPLTAMTVFSAALKYLKTKLFNTISEMTTGIEESDIGWVVTVPSIWRDNSKQFMREAARKAGIPEDNVMLALEPEAASLLCQHLPVDKRDERMDDGWMKWIFSFFGLKKERTPRIFETGSKYMIIDAGGGTVDITVHEVLGHQNVKEIYKANGGVWGGTTVDDRFCNLVTDLVGRECFQSFKKTETYDYLELMRDFERIKRTIKPDGCNKVRIRIPASLNVSCKKENSGMCLKDMIQKRQLGNKLEIIGDKLILSSDCMHQLFTDTIDKITNRIKDLLRDPKVEVISTIVMVGGFSDCEILKTNIRRAFPDKKVLIPNDAGLAVLKGAVMFGHNSSTIKERISRFSYGVRITKPFNPKTHDESKKIVIDDEELCDYIFSKFVEVDQSVKLGEVSKVERYTPAKIDGNTMGINVYASEEKNPLYVTDESCHKVGKISIDLSDLSDENKNVNVSMMFGRTELESIFLSRIWTYVLMLLIVLLKITLILWLFQSFGPEHH